MSAMSAMRLAGTRPTGAQPGSSVCATRRVVERLVAKALFMESPIANREVVDVKNMCSGKISKPKETLLIDEEIINYARHIQAT